MDEERPLQAQKAHRHREALTGWPCCMGAGDRGTRNWGLLWLGTPLGSRVLLSAALLAELRRLFSLVSARFALTLCVLRPGAWSYFFFS